MEKRSGVFLVKTDWWYIERLVWLIAGTDVVLSSILTAVHSPNWAFSILFVGVCSITVALTGFLHCRKCPLLPRREAAGAGQKDL